jgi:hypothetical protein
MRLLTRDRISELFKQAFAGRQAPIITCIDVCLQRGQLDWGNR